MSARDWSLTGFVLTGVAGLFLWGLAYYVYRSNRESYLNRMLSLTMVFMGFWMHSGFSAAIAATPNDTFTLWVFRWAYAAANMTAIAYLLFSIGLYYNRAPRKSVRMAIFLAGTFAAALSCTPLVFSGASIRDYHVTVNAEALHHLVTLAIVAPVVIGVYLTARKWRFSLGIDRARTSVSLFGIALFMALAVPSGVLVPAITGNEASSAFAYVSGLVPVGFYAYAIVRLRLLDVRIILRRSGVVVLGTLALVLPVVVASAFFAAIDINRYVEYCLLLALIMATIYVSPREWSRIERIASNLFFAELYDERELLDSVSGRLTAKADPQSGLLSAMAVIKSQVGLKEISLLIPPGVIDDKCWRFATTSGDGMKPAGKVETGGGFPRWLEGVSSSVVTEELQRWPRSAGERGLGSGLASAGYAACVPLEVSGVSTGYLLMKPKVNGRAFTSTDISVLEKAGHVFGLFIDNYSLSTRLGVQLKELERLYRELHSAYDFKSEVIQVASHEFRTPVTVINGFAMTLESGWDALDNEEKMQCVEGINKACEKLMGLTDKFLNISNLEEGRISVEKTRFKASELVRGLCARLRQEELERLIVEAEPDSWIVSDKEHLEAILGNLLDNAFRFSSADRPVVLRIWRDSVCDYIQVQDSGRGIPVEEREKVFEPFVRLESLTHHSKGIGLGLHIVRLLSARLGIEVELDSADGAGTTITLTLESS